MALTSTLIKVYATNTRGTRSRGPRGIRTTISSQALRQNMAKPLSSLLVRLGYAVLFDPRFLGFERGPPERRVVYRGAPSRGSSAGFVHNVASTTVSVGTQVRLNDQLGFGALRALMIDPRGLMVTAAKSGCKDRAILISRYHADLMVYIRAAHLLSGSDIANFDKAYAHAEHARIAFEKARSALDEHLVAHGCQMAEALIF
jgi:hypothetical protein